MNRARSPARQAASRRSAACLRRGRLDEGDDLLAHAVVGYPDHRRLADERQGVERVLDLFGMDVLAARDDHVVDPADEKQFAVLVEIAEVAGEIPAAADRFGVGVGPFPVAREGVQARHRRDDFADLAPGQDLVGPAPAVRVGENDAQFLAGRRAPGAARFVDHMIADGKGVDFRRPVEIDENLGLEDFGTGPGERRGHRRPGEPDVTDRREVGGRDAGMMDHVVEHRRHQEQRFDAFRLDQPDRIARVEGGHADEGAVERRRHFQRAHAHGVEQRHHAELHFPVAVAELRDAVERGVAFGVVRPRHALRTAGGPRGVEHQAGRRRIDRAAFGTLRSGR